MIFGIGAMKDFFKYLIDDYDCRSTEKDVLGRNQTLYFNDFLEIKIGPYFPRDPVEVYLKMKQTEYQFTPYTLALHYDSKRFRKWLISKQYFNLEEILNHNAQSLKNYGSAILCGDKKAWFEIDQVHRKFCKKRIYVEFFDLLYSKIVYL